MGFDDEGKVVIVEENIEDDEDDDLELQKRVRYLNPIIFCDKLVLCNVHGKIGIISTIPLTIMK